MEPLDRWPTYLLKEVVIALLSGSLAAFRNRYQIGTDAGRSIVSRVNTSQELRSNSEVFYRS